MTRIILKGTAKDFPKASEAQDIDPTQPHYVRDVSKIAAGRKS